MNDIFFPDAFLRGFIGADHLKSLNDRAIQMGASKFPPHNLEKTGESTYSLTFALAGFGPEDISLSVQGDMLTIETVRKADTSVPSDHQYIHRGISFRDFTRNFVLGEHINVQSASMENGLLTVSLERVLPEAAKPKRIPIGYNTKMESIDVGEKLKVVSG